MARKCVTLSLATTLVDELDEERGDVSRSRFVERLIRERLGK